MPTINMDRVGRYQINMYMYLKMFWWTDMTGHLMPYGNHVTGHLIPDEEYVTGHLYSCSCT